MEVFFYQTYTTALPIILTALMGYIVWLLKNQKKDRDAKMSVKSIIIHKKNIEINGLYKSDRIDKKRHILSENVGRCSTYETGNMVLFT